MSIDARELSDRFETVDGSRPEASPIDAEVAKRLPLGSFALLAQGDVFESVGGKPPPDGRKRARAYLDAKVKVVPHGAPAALVEQVLGELERQVAGSPELLARLNAARPISIDLVPPGAPMKKLGYPASVSPRASGLFWNQPDWTEARIAYRQERLGVDPALVVHEMAHAIHFLAFTEDERAQLYRLMLPTYRSKAAVDEVFAIYSEREFLPGFGAREKQAPGVYGVARQRWNEEHVMTRFVRHLYFPYKPLAGPRGSNG